MSIADDTAAPLLTLCFLRPLCSVGWNGIIGKGAENLVTVVLEHTSLTDFCGIPLGSLRENSITKLNLKGKGVGVPGALILSKLLSSATALRELKCVPSFAFRSNCHHIVGLRRSSLIWRIECIH